MGGKCYQQFAKVLILCYIPGIRSRRVELGPAGWGQRKGQRGRRVEMAGDDAGAAGPGWRAAGAYFLRRSLGSRTQRPKRPTKAPPAIRASIA